MYLFKIWLNNPFACVNPRPDWSWAALYMRIPSRIFKKESISPPFPCSPPGKLPNNSNWQAPSASSWLPSHPRFPFFQAFLSAQSPPLWGEMLCHKDTIVWGPSAGPVQHLMSFPQLPTLNCLCIKQDKNKEMNEKSHLWWYQSPPETIRHSIFTHILQKKNLSTNLDLWCQPQVNTRRQSKELVWGPPEMLCYSKRDHFTVGGKKKKYCVEMERFQTRDKVNFFHIAKLNGNFF